MKKKTLLFVCTWLVFLAVVVYTINAATTTSSRLSMNGENLVALNREAVHAKVSIPSKSPYLYFKFTTNQQARLSNLSKETEGVSVQVKIIPSSKKIPEKESSFAFGFLYEEDFESPHKLHDVIAKRPLVTGDFSKLSPNGFQVSMCLEHDHKIPVGFFVYGKVRYAVKGIQFTEAKIGWDRTDAIPVYSCSDEGGKIGDPFEKYNFSQALNVFATKNTSTTILPVYKIGLFPCKNIGPWDEQARVRLTIGGEDMSIRRTYGQTSETIQTAALINPFDNITLTAGGEMVSSIMLVANSRDLIPQNDGATVAPITTDPGLIPAWPKNNWRNKDYELFSWSLFPHVLFFDTADYTIQNKFFTRLAYFVEKEGYKGTFVSDAFIEANHGYNAHDYKEKDLALFFTEADKQKVSLNEYEILLRDILVKNKILIAQKNGSFLPGSGAVISISQESPEYLRLTFIAHESWHGIYFTDEDFRNTVLKIYNSFDAQSMSFIKTFWSTQNGLHYDLDDEYLMKNEFMAYLMQQSLVHTKDYFLQVAGRGSVNQIEPELAQYVRKTEAHYFVDAVATLNDYAYKRWGLAAGRVSLINR